MKYALSKLLLIAIIFSTCFLRLDGLGKKPLQFDEGVNWHLTDQSLKNDKVPYDPEHFHGPLFFELLRLSPSDSEASLRLVSAISGSLIVIATGLWLYYSYGIMPALSFSALLGFSHISIFYSQVAIHESLFSLLSLIFLLLISRWLVFPKWPYTLFLGVIFALLVLTKETFVVTLISSLAGAVLLIRRNNLKDYSIHLFFTALIVFLTCLFITQDYQLSLSSLKGVWSWWQKGLKDTTQLQPWWYHLLLLLKTAPLFFLVVPAFIKGKNEARFFIISSLASLLLYSLFPYKTPWLMISVLPPAYLGISLAFEESKKLSLITLASILLLFCPWPEKLLSQNDTYPEIFNLVRKIKNTCYIGSEKCKVFIGLKYYWPLPYYLRNLNADIHYSNKVPSIPVNLFDALLLPPGALPISGWNREEIPISRAQTTAFYSKY